MRQGLFNFIRKHKVNHNPERVAFELARAASFVIFSSIPREQDEDGYTTSEFFSHGVLQKAIEEGKNFGESDIKACEFFKNDEREQGEDNE